MWNILADAVIDFGSNLGFGFMSERTQWKITIGTLIGIVAFGLCLLALIAWADIFNA